MDKIRCLIVEDEPLAVEILASYIAEVPTLEWVGTAHSALEAMALLQQSEIDLIFLDIHLPKLSGMDWLRTLRKPPQVILCTAHHEYALEGFELNVVDYLLKPVEFERFLQAIQKLDHRRGKTPSPQRDFRFFNVNKRQVKVYLDEILYIESLREYVKIHTSAGSVTTQIPIGEIEQSLDRSDLIRVHRSFLVAKSQITAFSSAEIEIGDIRIPIGRTYKDKVGEELANWGGA